MARKGILLRVLEHDTGGKVFLTVLMVVAVTVVVLNLAVPEGSPLHVSTYTVTLLGKYLCYAAPRGLAEPQHGQGHGHTQRLGGCADLRPGLRHRGRGGRGLEPAHQRW